MIEGLGNKGSEMSTKVDEQNTIDRREHNVT